MFAVSLLIGSLSGVMAEKGRVSNKGTMNRALHGLSNRPKRVLIVLVAGAAA
jgi:hypothetical protein